MTREEIIAREERMAALLGFEKLAKALQTGNYYDECCDVDEFITEDDICRAIIALEKQMPKKPKEYEDKYYCCPICGNILLYKWEDYPVILTPKSEGLPYCLVCGQAIDWSEEAQE